MRWWIAAVLAAVAACGGRKEPAPKAPKDATVDAPPPATDAAAEACEKLPWPETISVPEASGSAFMDIDGTPGIVVAGDSGQKGAYVILDPETGAERETGKLPLGKSKSDDLEGLAVRDGALVALTSSGF